MNYEDLVETLALLRPKRNGKGTDLIINCPVCGQRECQISLKAPHYWQCFRKKACPDTKGVLESFKYYGFDVGNSYVDINSQLPSIDFFNTVPDKEKSVIPKLLEVEASDYIRQRTYYQVENMFIDPWKKDYVYLGVYEDKTLVGYCGRDISGLNKKQKYDNIIDSGEYIYGINNLNESVSTVLITEGAFSCHATRHKLGLKKKGVECIATFGANITDAHIRKIKERVGEAMIILMHEPDVLKIIKKEISMIDLHFSTFFVKLPENKDPDECTVDELFDTLSRPYNITQTSLLI